MQAELMIYVLIIAFRMNFQYVHNSKACARCLKGLYVENSSWTLIMFIIAYWYST